MEITELPTRTEPKKILPLKIETPKLIIPPPSQKKEVLPPSQKKEISPPSQKKEINWVPNVSPSKIQPKFNPRRPTNEEMLYFRTKYRHSSGSILECDLSNMSRFESDHYDYITTSHEKIGIKEEKYYIWHLDSLEER
jgi:hypothetical protein